MSSKRMTFQLTPPNKRKDKMITASEMRKKAEESQKGKLVRKTAEKCLELIEKRIVRLAEDGETKMSIRYCDYGKYAQETDNELYEIATRFYGHSHVVDGKRVWFSAGDDKKIQEAVVEAMTKNGFKFTSDPYCETFSW